MPSLRQTLAVAASAVAVSAEINVYYGQHGTTPLADVCATGVDYVTLAFINVTPENGGLSGYAGDNFGGHCWAGYYDDSVLLRDCPAITSGLSTCHELGTKVLLSIGGVFGSASNYTLSSDAEAEAFADFLWGSFGPYDASYSGPRPFDVDGEHFAIDGFDLDIEELFEDQGPWNTLVASLRAKAQAAADDILITAAPQCPYLYSGFEMGDILSVTKFDRIWVQFYNNPTCDALLGGFNYDGWISYLAGTPNSNTPLFVGLPGSPDAAGSGYVDPVLLPLLLESYSSHSNFGGVMLWDEYYAQENEVSTSSGNQTYLEYVQSLLSPEPSTSSVSSTATPTSTSTSSSSTLTSSTSTSVSTTSTLTSTSSSSPFVSSTSTSSSSSSVLSTATSTSSSSTSSKPTSSASSTSSILPTNSTSTSTSVLTSSSYTTISSTSTTSVASTGFSSSVYRNSTSASSTVLSTTSTIPANAASSDYTTITIQTTSVSTIYSCAPTVTNCPYNQVTTVVIDLYTTVCPVSLASQLTATASSTVLSTPASVTATPSVSTIYSTLYETITSCAATVTNCPARVTSKVVAVSTTVVSVPVVPSSSAASATTPATVSVPVVNNAGSPPSSAIETSSIVIISSKPYGNYSYTAPTGTGAAPSPSLAKVVVPNSSAIKGTGSPAVSTSSSKTTSSTPAKSTVPVVTAGASVASSSLSLTALLAAAVVMFM